MSLRLVVFATYTTIVIMVVDVTFVGMAWPVVNKPRATQTAFGTIVDPFVVRVAWTRALEYVGNDF